MLAVDDIQGLVVRGYGPLRAAQFLVLRVVELAAARRYLQTICDDVNTAAHSPDRVARQIAFTAPGLVQLGITPDTMATFSREFLEGMDDDVRAISLGDEGANAPSQWTWGQRAQDNAHVLVMLYAKDERELAPYLAAEVARLDGFAVIQKSTITLPDNKEHFGWRDGLSMPVFAGVPESHKPAKKTQETWTAPLAPGEFVLGYPNEYECFTERPTTKPEDDPADLLPVTNERKDLGKNGTYLVYREMTQDVHALWDYLAKHSREAGADPTKRAIALGAKLVGRWPNGAPLMTADHDDHRRALDNKFVYSGESSAMKCPVGAHIRRANPRDQLTDRSTSDSEIMVRRHQMVRRGRSFGPPLSPRMRPEDLIAAPEDDAERGLHFICLVGHIARQFEFVQRAWIHSANFNGLYKDGDPISGARRTAADGNQNDELTVPADPVRRKYKAMPQFTTLVGGAYFFLPGIRALHYIAKGR